MMNFPSLKVSVKFQFVEFDLELLLMLRLMVKTKDLKPSLGLVSDIRYSV